MSIISPVGLGSATSARQVVRQSHSSQKATQSSATTALQEVNETEAVTRQEAANGDQVAIRKLAQEQAQQELLAVHTPKYDVTKKNSSLDIVEIKGVSTSRTA